MYDKGGIKSGREDLNLRPPAPEAGALAGLRYAPFRINYTHSYQLCQIFYLILNPHYHLHFLASESESDEYDVHLLLIS